MNENNKSILNGCACSQFKSLEEVLASVYIRVTSHEEKMVLNALEVLATTEEGGDHKYFMEVKDMNEINYLENLKNIKVLNITTNELSEFKTIKELLKTQIGYTIWDLESILEAYTDKIELLEELKERDMIIKYIYS